MRVQWSYGYRINVTNHEMSIIPQTNSFTLMAKPVIVRCAGGASLDSFCVEG